MMAQRPSGSFVATARWPSPTAPLHRLAARVATGAADAAQERHSPALDFLPLPGQNP